MKKKILADAVSEAIGRGKGFEWDDLITNQPLKKESKKTSAKQSFSPGWLAGGIFIVALMIFLSGCSSPPPPTPIEWDKTQSLNTGIPEWRENNLVIPSDTVSGRWMKILNNFKGDEGNYDISVYYAIAHSPVIVVHTSGGAFFKAKEWLRKLGAKGVIQYHPVTDCMLCTNTSIYFSR
ncbi:TPA: cag pathogenicity island Cag12 family protein [Enterobacter hormaechei]